MVSGEWVVESENPGVRSPEDGKKNRISQVAITQASVFRSPVFGLLNFPHTILFLKAFATASLLLFT